MSAEMRATALYNRGLSQQKLPNLSAAVEDYTSALFLDPSFAHAYYGRGNALRESGQFLFALSDYEKATRYHHPNAANGVARSPFVSQICPRQLSQVRLCWARRRAIQS